MLLETRGLSKAFDQGTRSGGVYALRDVDLRVCRGEVVAVVGESGSGKTTLTRCLLGLERPTGGDIVFGGRTREDHQVALEFRRKVQPVFQDPWSSLDPRWTARRTIREALDCLSDQFPRGRAGRRARDAEVDVQLDRVGLPLEVADRKPHELSGGQRQRVAIAAALASGPELLIADEPVTALDVSVQAQVLNLLANLRTELHLAVLFVSHDLSVVEHISDRIVVLQHGAVVEKGATRQVMAHPQHPYTRELLAAVPGHQRIPRPARPPLAVPPNRLGTGQQRSHSPLERRTP